jgi:hypothetical protein
MTIEDKSLQKAHSAGVHLARMTKAIGSFHDTIGKLADAHHDDMNKAVGQLHKVLGSEPGAQDEIPAGGEPVATDLTSAGTKNLQDFGDIAKAMTAVGYTITAPDPLTKESFTKAEVTALLEKSQKELATSLLEGLLGKAKKEDDAKDGEGDGKAAEKCPECGKDMEDCKCDKIARVSKGIGNRSTPREPVRGSIALTKSQDGMLVLQPNQADPTSTPVTTDAHQQELVTKAANGDIAASLELMKGAKPGDIPATLSAALSKIH